MFQLFVAILVISGACAVNDCNAEQLTLSTSNTGDIYLVTHIIVVETALKA